MSLCIIAVSEVKMDRDDREGEDEGANSWLATGSIGREIG